jgi:ubiquinone/menaquinone biosynthesis C-methylase UbiE
MPAASLDPAKLQAMTQQVSGSLVGGLNCALTLIGDQLGLYKALVALGSANSEQLADKTALSERWVREWLYQQSCVGQISHDEPTDKFSLVPEAAAVLADEDHPAYLGGMFHSVVAMFDTVKDLPECFRTGIGQSYDDKGENCACGIERMSRKFQAKHLVPDLLPRLDGMVERLEQGASVADVGCGAAGALTVMAQAFPESEFTGYDISLHALSRARRNVQAAGIRNVTLRNPVEHGLPEDGSLDFVTTLDVIHDSTHPDILLDAIRRSLKPDGIWLCADIQGRPTFAENKAENPIATIAYSFSVMVCMSAGLSVEGGAGLGTLGFHEQKAREMSAAAGFTRFRRVPFEGDVFNAFYEIRP